MTSRDALAATPRWAVALLALAVLAGAALRVRGIASRGFEYDELYTLRNYVGADPVRVLFGVGPENLPNNHRLSTLLIRLSGGGAEVEWRTRLPALVLGILALPLLFALGARVTGEPLVAALATASYALSSWAIYFSQSGRGYSLGAFLVLAHALLWWRWRIEDAGWSHGVAAVLVALAGTWNLPSFVFYLAPVYALGFLRDARTGRRARILADGLATGAIALWTFYARENLALARERFGVHPATAADLARALYEVVRDVYVHDLPIWILLPGVAGLFRVGARPAALGALAILALPLLAGAAGSLAPERVYTYAIPFAHLLVAWGLVRLFEIGPRARRLAPFALGAAVLSLAPGLPGRLETVLPPDYRALVQEVEARRGPGDAIAYLLHDALPASLYGGPRTAAAWRAESPRPLRLVVVEPEEPGFPWVFDWIRGRSLRVGLDRSRSTFLGRAEKREIRAYALQPVQGPVASGSILVAVLHGAIEESPDPVAELPLEWVGMTNPWFDDPATRLALVRAMRDLSGPPALPGWSFLRAEAIGE